MPSSRRRQQPDPPIFFLDRSLGRYQVTEALETLGFTVHTLWSVYGDDAEQTMDDEKWIEEGAAKGWVLLTKDDIRFETGPREAMERSGARVFYLSRQDLLGPEQVRWFVNNINKIVQRSRKRGPYAQAVYENDVVKRWPPATKYP